MLAFKLADRANRFMATKGESSGRDKFGISRYILLCIKQINNKVLLYSAGNDIQYAMINHNEKEYKKEYIYI